MWDLPNDDDTAETPLVPPAPAVPLSYTPPVAPDAFGDEPTDAAASSTDEPVAVSTSDREPLTAPPPSAAPPAPSPAFSAAVPVSPPPIDRPIFRTGTTASGPLPSLGDMATSRPVAAPGSDTPTPALTPVPSPQRSRRVWPLVLLALFTVAASGVLSWFVANQVNDSSSEVAVALDGPADVGTTVRPALADPETPAPIQSPIVVDGPVGSFDREAFARAAEMIAPSVVQLTVPGEGLGTGIIIDADGTILTAAHVVGESTDVRVTFSDGSSVDGEVVGAHSDTDVAVVKVSPEGRSLVAAPLADGDEVRVGQFAVAVGSPFGFDQTVTAGIISAVDRVVNTVSMVQTDAPINPGNSGGPLINLDGEVVGINDLIFTESGSNAGVGFAISIDLAVIVADQLIAGEEVQLALLGVSTNQPTNGEAGAQIAEVVAGTAAEDAGLQVGDIVVGVDGLSTRGSSALRAQVVDRRPGTTITLDVLRNGEMIELVATLGSTG
ncbi:MAG: S1C family serine protease [Acidimicrobiales bacterium]